MLRKTALSGAVAAIAALLFGAASLNAAPVKLARHPDFNAGRITFSYLGDIWTAGEDGNGVHRLTDNLAREVYPRFSPDGKWIVFTSDRAGFRDEWYLTAMMPQPYGDLFAIRADGSGSAVQLTDDKWEDGLPFWATVR